VIGVILGPMADENLRRALMVSQGDLTPFFTRPVSLILISAIVLLVLVQTPLYRRLRVQAGIGMSKMFGRRG